MSGLSDRDFTLVRDYLLARCGLAFEESRRATLSSVITERVSHIGAVDVADYLRALDRPGGEAERQQLFDSVIVGETQFFRNTPQMEALRRRVSLRALAAASVRRRPVAGPDSEG